MKLAVIIYGISCLILLLVYVVSKFQKKDSLSKEPWYLYAIIIVFAPLVVLLIPYILINSIMENRKQKRITAEREQKRALEEQKKQVAIEYYKRAIQENNTHCISDEYIQVATYLYLMVDEKKYSQFMSCLKALSLPSNSYLDVEECKHNGSGDISRLYVCLNGVNDLEIWKYICVEDSFMGAWQIYLLHTLYHSLPLFWHGCYNLRSFVFSKDDFSRISFIRKKSSFIAHQLVNYNITPEVVKYGDKYYITCCYWSNWSGLVRELIEITIRDNKVAEIFDVNRVTLYEYECGIMF